MQPGLAIITGATGGLGYETALGLARAGHEILLTGRDVAKGQTALQSLRAAIPTANARFALLDVASLASVAAFSQTVQTAIAILVNNAGVMALPHREITVDGFERQLATNYLGHFALTARLRPNLNGARVVNLSSVAHRRGRIDFEDMQGEKAYSPWAAYAQTKLAMLMFSLELHRRSTANGWNIQSIAAHPGWSATSIVLNGPGRGAPGLRERIMQAGFNLLGQSAYEGARPTLYAALDPAAQSGAYYGPCCWGETRGHPAPARIMPQASNQADCARLWDATETLVR